MATSPNGQNGNHFTISKDQSVDLLVKACLENGITNEKQIAYVLATAQHETMNFQKPEEIDGRHQAQKLHYQGGADYFGRGYVHVTHERNYRALGEAIGLGNELVRHPEKAKDPEIAAKIAAVGMRDGLFTGKELSDYINDKHANYEGARKIINGTDKAALIAGYAHSWEKKVPELVKAAKEHGVQSHETAPKEKHHGGQHGAHGPSVAELQTKLGQLGFVVDSHGKPLTADGKFGPLTLDAVKTFQHVHHLKEDGVAGPTTLKAIEAALKEQKAHAQAAPTTSLTTHGLNDPALYKQALAGLEKYNADHKIQSTPVPLLNDDQHPGNGFYKQALAGLEKINAERGIPSDQRTCNAAGTLAASACESRFKQIDRVALNDNGSKIIAVQGELGTVQSKVIGVDTMLALDTPLAQSSHAFSVAFADAHTQQQNQRSQQVNQPVQAQTGPALA